MKLVFTNGCFDRLHSGHLKVLQVAKSMGRVVVGLNSDAGVSRLKGPGRPSYSQDIRKKELLATGIVDEVVIFDEPTPLKLIVDLRPNVLVRGLESSSIVGSREVLAWGGMLVLVPKLEGISTTSILLKESRAV